MIDISHHNGTKLRFDKAKADGIIGVIQKATQGETYVDATFKKNKEAILAALRHRNGWGMDVVQPDEDTVVVLDFESNPA